MKSIVKISLLLLAVSACLASSKSESQVMAIVSAHFKMPSFGAFVAAPAHAADCRTLVPVYRYFDGKDHLFTTSAQEIGTTTLGQVGAYNYRCEGIAFYAYSTTTSTCTSTAGQPTTFIPVYRYFNGADRLYTTNAKEIGTTTPGAVGAYNYRFETIAFYVPA